MTVLVEKQWVQVTTTTTDTAFQVEDCLIRFTTTDPSGSNFVAETDSIRIRDSDQINGIWIVPPGLTVWIMQISGGTKYAAFTPYGI